MTTLDAPPLVAPETATPLIPLKDEGVPAAPPETSKRWKIALLLILLLIFGLLLGWYLFNRKPLTELPGLSQAKVPHYEFSMYGTTKPIGVAVTPTGDRIYVTESDGTRLVRVFDRAGKQTGTLKPPTSTGASHLPMYVAIDPATQDVYVSDRLTASIYIYDAKGTYVRTFAPKGKLVGQWAPLGLTFSPGGDLYVTDVEGRTPKTHRVLVFGPDGTLLRSLGTPGQFNFPNGIAVDSHSDVNVADSNNGRLLIFNAAGKALATINPGIGDGDLGLPRGVAVDESGRLYVVDTADHQVRVYLIGSSTTTPKYVASFGTEGQLDGTFEYPNGIATDKRAHIYVTDRENNRVQVWGY
jgi:DNA-binding beta-propeller fold protein YncE